MSLARARFPNVAERGSDRARPHERLREVLRVGLDHATPPAIGPSARKRPRADESQNEIVDTIHNSLALLSLKAVLDTIDPKTARRACLEKIRDEVLLDMKSRDMPYTMTLHFQADDHSTSHQLTIPLMVTEASDELIKFKLAEPDSSYDEPSPISKGTRVTFNFMTTSLTIDCVIGGCNNDFEDDGTLIIEEPYKAAFFTGWADKEEKWYVMGDLDFDMSEHKEHVKQLLSNPENEDQEDMRLSEVIEDMKGSITEVEMVVKL